MPFDKKTISRRKTLKLLGTAGLASATPRIVTAEQIPALPHITNGINIPLWMDQPDGSAYPPSQHVLALLSRFGFKTVRLPVDPDRFAAGGVETLKASLELDQIIKTLSEFGFSVTLDMHPRGQIAKALSEGEAGHGPLDAAWGNLAKVGAQFAPQTTFLELLNEPDMWRDRWLPLRDRLAQTTRKICPEHTLIWGANKWQSIAETISCPPLDDENAIAAVHYYSPMPFTHQCQNWGTPDPKAPQNLPFPATLSSPEVISALENMSAEAAADIRRLYAKGWGAEQIHEDFESLANWSRLTGTKTILNEFGTLKFCADQNSRIRWTRAVRQACLSSDIGWTYWEFDRGFGFMDDRTSLSNVEVRLVAALIGERVS